MAIRSYKLGVISDKLKVRNCIAALITYHLSLIILSSCSFKKEIPPPPDLIDENKMALVISEITISEAALNNEPLASFNDTLKKINVLKEYKISNAQFLLSMKYYSENPKKLKGIYAEASEILNKKLPAADTIAKK